MYKRYLVFNVGCIECRVSSNVVGMYDTETEAQAIQSKCEKHFDWREGGQNSFEVFDLEKLNNKEYAEVLGDAP